MPTYRSAALSDTGRIRHRNEDRLLWDPKLGLYGVADGIGGLPGGAEAAQCAVEGVLKRLIEAQKKGEDPKLETLISETNADLVSLSRQLSPVYGMGTTLCFGLLRQDCLSIVHLGDSRCYLFRKCLLKLLTLDHTVENEANQRRERGERIDYPPQQAAALTRCLGQWSEPQADLFDLPLLAGDRVLFCTDGISKPLRQNEIEAALKANPDPEAAVGELIRLANQRGGPDNSTAVLLTAD